MNYNKELRGRLLRGTCNAWKASLYLCVELEDHSLILLSKHNRPLITRVLKDFSINLLSLKVVRPSVDMIVCRTCCECKKMKCCPEEQNLGFVESSTFLPISQCTLMKMVTQLITKRLSNFKTYYFVIPPSRVLHQNKNLVKMIFCKRRIGVLNFSGYYNRKRTRRWHVNVH